MVTKNLNKILLIAKVKIKQTKFIGNNSELIRRCLTKRSNWKEASSKYSSVYNLKWGQTHYSMDYNLLSDKLPVIKVIFYLCLTDC